MSLYPATNRGFMDLEFKEIAMKSLWENRHLLTRLAGLPFLDEERVFKLIQKELGDDHEIVKSIKKENPSLQNSSHSL